MEGKVIMDDEQHRYLFTVRQRFNKEPIIDCFYKLVTEDGLTNDQMKMWKTLDGDFQKKEIKEDTDAFSGMSLRLRFNSDMYQDVCLVRTYDEITAEVLESIIQDKYRTKDLETFLEKSKV